MSKSLNEMNRMELIQEAGKLNNNAKLINTDHVTFMGFLDRDECQRHVEKLIAMIGE